jgi:pSer/pThr/pTyr-binding forkhead associated (FHA) protein
MDSYSLIVMFKPTGKRQTKEASAAPGNNLRLVVQTEAPQRRTFNITFVQSVVLGRGSDEDSKQPDIDLTPAGAKDAGVSRFHARIQFQEDTLFIEDMGSTNGTRINGFELIGGKSYRLTPGDEIELGSLRLTVRLMRGAN